MCYLKDRFEEAADIICDILDIVYGTVGGILEITDK
jgi:hypothetical protein